MCPCRPHLFGGHDLTLEAPGVAHRYDAGYSRCNKSNQLTYPSFMSCKVTLGLFFLAVVLGVR